MKIIRNLVVLQATLVVGAMPIAICAQTTSTLSGYSWGRTDPQGVTAGLTGPSTVGIEPRAAARQPNSSNAGYVDEDLFSVALRNDSSTTLHLCRGLPEIKLTALNAGGQKLHTGAGSGAQASPVTLAFRADVAPGAMWHPTGKTPLIITDTGSRVGSYVIVAHVRTNVCNADGSFRGSVNVDSGPYTVTLH